MSGIENLTIMLTDIVGFSRMVSSMSRGDSATMLSQHNKLLKKIIKQFRGQHIKSIGDSFLVVFRSPTDAILCAMAIQDCFGERNQDIFVGLSTALVVACCGLLWLVVACCTWWTTMTFMPTPDSIEMDRVAIQYNLQPKPERQTQPEVTQPLEILPDINEEIRLKTQNLVKLLDYQRLPVNKLLGAYMYAPIANELAARTGGPRLRARYDAFYLLKDSDNVKKVNTVGLNTWDLRELKGCRLKHVAVKELLRLGDPRALPVLKEVVN